MFLIARYLKTSFAALALAGLLGCSHGSRQDQESAIPIVRICDSSGCSDRPKNYASPSFTAATTEAVMDSRMLALEELAKNDPRAAYDLSLRYFRGDGVRQDSYKSVQFMRDAAERGNLDAQKALGRLYLAGLGEMGADYSEAHRWLSITAGRGDKEAARLLQQVGSAKQWEQAQNLAGSRWRSIYYNSWQTGYPYQYSWRYGSWYPY